MTCTVFDRVFSSLLRLKRKIDSLCSYFLQYLISSNILKPISNRYPTL